MFLDGVVCIQSRKTKCWMQKSTKRKRNPGAHQHRVLLADTALRDNDTSKAYI